ALFEMPPPAPPKCRLFLGIFPSMEAIESIATLQVELKHQFGLGGKFRPRQILHVTLHYNGDYLEWPGRTIEAVGEACAAAVTGLQPFEVIFDHVMSFRGTPGSLPLVLVCPDGSEALRQLHHRFINELARRGVTCRKDSKIVPHVTLLYDK